MRVTRLVTALAVACAACVGGGQASAYEVARGATAVPSVSEDAEACFAVYASDHVYAVATAHGVVTAPLPDPPKALLGGERGAAPTHPVAQAQPGWGREFPVCVGGVGSRATSGRVVYTLHAHGPNGDLTLVLGCTFSREAPPACA